MNLLRYTPLLAALMCSPASAQHADMDPAMHAMDSMSGALGPYAMTREASGTSWQPDATPMGGLHFMQGDWMLMAHGFADTVYDRQGGPRGDDKLYVASMAMLMAQRDLGPGTFGARGMVSLDPLMGRSGYPLLFQSGETADGETLLVDRQHPHDLFMELSASYSLPLGEASSVFGYLGLPGEPALGPAAFMHRASGMQLPEAPLTHHWLDSTHITFGVATLGWVHDRWKLEGSIFNGREPDQARWNIETRRLDSYSGRLSFNPSAQWSLQVSHGFLRSPEQLEPQEAVHRSTASASYTGDGGHWSTTLAYGLNRSHGDDHPAWLLESTREFPARFALFGRAEWINTSHLFAEESPLHGRDFDIGKLSLGGVKPVGTLGALNFEIGASGSVYLIPKDARSEYGSDPLSVMVFLRTRL